MWVPGGFYSSLAGPRKKNVSFGDSYFTANALSAIGCPFSAAERWAKSSIVLVSRVRSTGYGGLPDWKNSSMYHVSGLKKRAPGGADWWEIQFVSLAGGEDLLGILGTIQVLPAPKETPFALPEQLMALRDQQAARYRLEDLEPSDPVMQRLVEQARLASQTHVPITLVGEAGVGKEWLARAIHLRGERRQRYFIALDAERLPAGLIAEVLFGPRSRQLAPGMSTCASPACCRANGRAGSWRW